MILERLKLALKIALALTALSSVGAIVGLMYIQKDLPKIESVEDYHPILATKIYSDDGHLVARYARERRTLMPIEVVPEHVIHSFLAAEDRNFFQHEGLDYLGILRAAIKNLRPGAHLQGASTITQQTVKTLILGPERSYSRKMKEAVLSRQLEQLLTKREILYLYLNQIYFGTGAWGIEEAAQSYFGKSVRELTLSEGAYLAGTPKNPSRYNIRANPEASRKRQHYVLEQMLSAGWASEEEVTRIKAEPVPRPAPRPTYLNQAPHYSSIVLRELVEKFGETAVYETGLTVYTGMSAALQLGAHRATEHGLERVARHHGYPGATLRIEVDRFEAYMSSLKARLSKELAKQSHYAPKAKDTHTPIWNLSAITAEDLADEVRLSRKLQLHALHENTRVTAVVTQIDSVAKNVEIDLGTQQVTIPLKKLRWARRFSPTAGTRPPRDPSDILQRGDLVAVDIRSVKPGAEGESPKVTVELVPTPRAEGALVSIDPHSRLVRAIVGGYARTPGGFNRATQALRQPGSAFKPIVYAAGLLERVITPASICPDSPVVIRDKWTGEAWKPENYEDGQYDGNITYRRALTRSKNTCSVKLIEALGVDPVTSLARKLGIQSKLPENLTLALGTGEVTALELANAYATIASGGFKSDPIFIRKVVGADGKILMDHRAQPERVLDEDVAFVLTHMMQSVVEEGTAVRAQRIGRSLAGKTGTTNRSRNAWFAGFSPGLVAVTWVGFDDNSPLGRLTGSSAALPIWVDYMEAALDGTPNLPFRPPSNVVFRRVDADTGKASSDVGNIEEVFVAGTEPDESTDELPSIFIGGEEELGAQLP